MFSIAICHLIGDKWQSKTLILTIFYLHSLIVLMFFIAACRVWSRSPKSNQVINRLRQMESCCRSFFTKPDKIWWMSYGNRIKHCMLGNFSCFKLVYAYFFFKIIFFKQFFQGHKQGVKWFGSKIGWTFCPSWSGCKLFAKIIRWQVAASKERAKALINQPIQMISDLCQVFNWCWNQLNKSFKWGQIIKLFLLN